MKENLTLYNDLREVPKDAQKTITGGRLNGFTDINSMWRIKALTEQFGPCGEGWYLETKDFWSEEHGDETAVFVIVNLYYKTSSGEWSAPVTGIGGNKVVKKEKGGSYVSDEAYKMAETDAIGSACKKLGMGADVYWKEDRTKYSVEEDTPKQEEDTRYKVISSTKVKALRKKIDSAGITPDKVCLIYHVKQLEELVEVQFENINRNWDKVVESCKAL